MSSSHKAILYWLLLILIGFGLRISNISGYIASKIFALYLLIGVFISFKYKITIFKKGKFSDPIEDLDEIGIFANVFILLLSLYILFFN